MVLEGASGATETDPFARDATPSSDLDPYGPGQSSLPEAPSTMDMQLPQAVPLLGPLLGYTKSYTKRTVDKGLSAASQIIKRPLRREEIEALAYNLAKMERTSSVGATLGLSAGLYRAWSTADTFRFPFYKPNLQTFNAEAFATLRGAVSRAAIHSLRGLAFGSTGVVFGTVFAKSYAAMVTVVAFQSDPRLKDVNQSMRDMAAKRSGKTLDNGGNPASTPQSRKPYVSSDPMDDMSPQSSSYDAPESGMMSDREMREQDVGQQADEPTAPAERVQSAWQTDRSASYNGNSDDMSPQARPGGSAPNQPQESAWDRVRRQSSQQAPRSAKDKRTLPSQNATLGDSFSFSATDEERQLAKEEAQKEFDARIERERQGNDFEEGSRSKRW